MAIYHKVLGKSITLTPVQVKMILDRYQLNYNTNHIIKINNYLHLIRLETESPYLFVSGFMPIAAFTNMFNKYNKLLNEVNT